MVSRVWILAVLLLAACERPEASSSEASGAEAGGEGALRTWLAVEVERLAAASAELGENGEALAGDLAAVAAEAEAGRGLYAASRLASHRLQIEAPAYRSERREAVHDLETLEAEAARVAGELERREAALAAALPGRPAAVRALADAGWVRGRAYHGAAAAYARVTSVDSGLYYLGAARSLLGTAADLAAVPVRASPAAAGRTPSPAVLEAELADLDRRAVAAYRAPGAEVERHADFIALNAEIKEARDLLAAGRSDGVLLAALEARARLEEVLDDGTGPGATELRERAASFRARCEAARWDASVGRLLVETAEAALAADPPRESGLRSARALLLHVLPRYFHLHEETP